MAPRAGVSRSEARVPENPRAVSSHGQPMQSQASRESGRSWPPGRGRHGKAVCRGNNGGSDARKGNISRRSVTGGADLTTNPTASHIAKGSAKHPSLVGKGDGAEREVADARECGRCLEIPLSNRQVKGRRCVAFRSPKGGDNHWTHASSQVCSSWKEH
jgi:hypothetical protein